ncbi:MAG: cobalamin-dependent protein [Deltaproteobacteria bacterium]|nr:cobalamin-dependent protein [Deltaproteobacteria bacterium]
MEKLSEAIVALNKKRVVEIVKAGIDAGRDPLELVDDARDGMEGVGIKFDAGEFYLIELIQAAKVFQAAAELLNPVIKKMHGDVAATGKMVIATVAGDVHDLGKNIVKILLECKGVEVIDLGVDVPTDRIVESVKEHKPQVLGLSALLTASVPEMNKVAAKLREVGLRDNLKIICGGGIVGDIREEMKVDFTTVDANEGVKKIESWMNKRRSL